MVKKKEKPSVYQTIHQNIKNPEKVIISLGDGTFISLESDETKLDDLTELAKQTVNEIMQSNYRIWQGRRQTYIG